VIININVGEVMIDTKHSINITYSNIEENICFHAPIIM